MDTLVLLPNFIQFFSEAINHSSSPGNLAIIFLAFGKCFAWIDHFFFPFELHVLVSAFSLLPCSLQIVYLDAVLNLAFALSLLCFIIMHASLVSSNTTSVEVTNTLFTCCFLDFDSVNLFLTSYPLMLRFVSDILLWPAFNLFLGMYEKLCQLF